MIATLLLALGLLLVIEGLFYAFIPGHLRGLANRLNALSDEQLRIVGTAAIGAGVFVIWLTRVFLQV